MSGSPSQMAETLSGLGRLTELRQRLLFVFAALIIYRIGNLTFQQERIHFIENINVIASTFTITRYITFF